VSTLIIERLDYTMLFRPRSLYARGILTSLLFCLLSAADLPLTVPSAWGLEDGRIGVLYIGSVLAPVSLPFWHMRSDMLFRSRFVPANLRGDWMTMGPMPAAGEAGVHRMVRLYMPRTYQNMVDDYDVIVLSEANQHAMNPHIEKLAKGVSEGGLGLLMCGGWASFGGSGDPPWGQTAIGRLLPTDDVTNSWCELPNQRLVIDQPNHELIGSVPWDDPALRGPISYVWNHNPVTLKPGAEQLAHVVLGSGRQDPLMVTWEVEGGARTFAFTSMTYQLVSYAHWTYLYDLASNLMIYLDRRPVPQDIGLVHALRSKILEVAARRSMLVSLLDFCESFGANTHGVVLGLEEVDHVVTDAGSQYLDLHFEAALESYYEAAERMEEVESRAVRLKERALLWVYVIEWLTVTGTAVFCGVVHRRLGQPSQRGVGGYSGGSAPLACLRRRSGSSRMRPRRDWRREVLSRRND
jgi:uncharacterized membrane protein